MLVKFRYEIHVETTIFDVNPTTASGTRQTHVMKGTIERRVDEGGRRADGKKRLISGTNYKIGR